MATVEQTEIDVREWRVPDGMVAITIDSGSQRPLTFAVGALDLMGLMDNASPDLGATPYGMLVGWVVDEMRTEVDPNSDVWVGVGIVALWTALYNPRGGELMRRELSRLLRLTDRAHISWCVDGNGGLAFSLGTEFSGLSKVLAQHSERGAGPVAVLWAEPEGEPERQQ